MIVFRWTPLLPALVLLQACGPSSDVFATTDLEPTDATDAPVDPSGDGSTAEPEDAAPGDRDASAEDAGVTPAPSPLPVFSAYFASTTAHGDHIAEMRGAFTAGHVDLAFVDSAIAAGVRPIVNLHWLLFDFPEPLTTKPTTFAPTARATLRADIDAQLDKVEKAIGPNIEKVAAFYIVDEPYSPPWLVPRTTLEAAITKVKARFPNTATTLVIAHHCFDPAVPPLSATCSSTFPGKERGVPANVDWAMFDWYTNGDPDHTMVETFTNRVVAGVERMKKVTNKPIVLVGESYSKNRSEPELVELAHRYYALLRSEPQVQGIDWFLWADVLPSFRGLAGMPTVRRAVRALGRDLLHRRGEDSGAVVPITEWVASDTADHDYRAWYFDGWEKTEFIPSDAAFGLLAVGTPHSVPFYKCHLSKGDSSFLTTDSTCGADAGGLAATPVVIGAISSRKQSPATAALHRWVHTKAPYDHLYSTDPNRTVPGYAYQFPVGYVVPPEGL